MYRTARDVWHGFTKNTHEGLGAPARIVPATLMLLVGQVAPFPILFASSSRVQALFATAAIAAVVAARVSLAVRFRQTITAVLLHPLGILVLVAMQWAGLIRWISGKPARWKSREYASGSAGDRVLTADAGEHLPERV